MIIALVIYHTFLCSKHWDAGLGHQFCYLFTNIFESWTCISTYILWMDPIISHYTVGERQKRTRQLDWKPSYCKAKPETDREPRPWNDGENIKKSNLYLSALISPLSPFHSFFQHSSVLLLMALPSACIIRTESVPLYPPFTGRTLTYISHLSNPQWFIIVSVLSSRQNTNYHLITIITKWEKLTGSNQIEKGSGSLLSSLLIWRMLV